MDVATFFYYNDIKLLVRINYDVHEMKKSETEIKRTQNLLKITCR